MKSKKLWLGIGAVVLIVLCMGVAFLATQGKTDYYTQIDNRWVTEIDPYCTMNFVYYLVAFVESGIDRDITFVSSKVVSDGEFLFLILAPIRGVVTWAEVQYDELPEAVQAVYSK